MRFFERSRWKTQQVERLAQPVSPPLHEANPFPNECQVPKEVGARARTPHILVMALLSWSTWKGNQLDWYSNVVNTAM